MRYAVLADIHANLHAFDAVLNRLRKVGVDRYLIAGDLVGYGPYPNECVERAVAVGATCVAGNHDLIVTGRLGDDRCNLLAKRSLEWTRSVLRHDVLAYLDALPTRADVDAGVVMAHGTLDDAREYTLRADQADEQLAQLSVEHPSARILLLGHTHHRLAYGQGGRRLAGGARGGLVLPERALLNPGSVGQSRGLLARARFLVLDTEAWTAVFHQARYDTSACRAALRRRGLPVTSHHRRPTARRIGRNVVRRAKAFRVRIGEP
jgi:predicted phosphodiesterase